MATHLFIGIKTAVLLLIKKKRKSQPIFVFDQNNVTIDKDYAVTECKDRLSRLTEGKN